MTHFVTDLGPGPEAPHWTRAQETLRRSGLLIAHIDSGLFAHPSLGFRGDAPPPNIILAEGRNFHDPEIGGDLPLTTLDVSGDDFSGVTEYPDHGVKTLSVILSDNDKLRGVAPGARVAPYRVANGPLFVGRSRSGRIGQALTHARRPSLNARVASISMGNPGVLGPFELLRGLIGGEVGMSRETGRAVDAAYEAGMIVVCAAGQVIEQVVYPARYARTIAVGGITSDGEHYPTGGYPAPDIVDAWALASGINRAAGVLRPNGRIVPVHAGDDDPAADQGEPSGTSYACPQVAAAAALWLATHDSALKVFAAERWKIVEAFRKALRESARAETVPSGRRGVDPIAIRRLDIERLIRTPPALDFAYRKRDKAGIGLF